MPDYLTKEEMRQWRSSLEKITLEDFAKRLGKVISEEKETNDIVDMMMKQNNTTRYVSNEPEIKTYNVKAERISSLAQQSFDREKELTLQKQEKELRKNINIKKETSKIETKKEIVEVKSVKEVKKAPLKEETTKSTESSIREEVQVTFKKNLTPREQAVFEHFLNNKNNIVYAKELAQVLDLPRDYVYKYIKNLRAKMNEDAIQNSDNGGFVLAIK